MIGLVSLRGWTLISVSTAYHRGHLIRNLPSQKAKGKYIEQEISPDDDDDRFYIALGQNCLLHVSPTSEDIKPHIIIISSRLTAL